MPQLGTVAILFYIFGSVSGGFFGFFPAIEGFITKAQSTCPRTEQRFPNLFVSQKLISSLSSSRRFQETYRVDKISQRFPFPGTCSKRNEYSMITLSTCDSFSPERKRERTFDICCETILSITIPNSVTSLFTGQQSQVVHLPSSYQLLHEAQCAKPNSRCSTGKCRLAYRIQWILVEQGSQQTFVPVSVGNHCYCSFE